MGLRSTIFAALVTVPALGLLFHCGTDNGDLGKVEEIEAGPSLKRDTGTTQAADAGVVDIDSGVEDSGPPPDSGTCYDPNDQGGSEVTAKDLPDIDDCDTPVMTKQGVAAGTIDKDFFHFHASDGFTCQISPTATSATAGLEFCMFSKCLGGGSTDFKGCSKGTAATSDIGMKGCCVTTPGTLTYDYNCTGTIDEAADVFVRVKNLSETCQPYSFTVNF